MINQGMARTQAESLDGYAALWKSADDDGASEVAFLLDRAAKMIRRCIGDLPPEPESDAEKMPPADLRTQPRED